MKIVLNGSPRELEGETFTVAGLLAALELGPQPVLVERNGEAVLSREFESAAVEEGDVVEIVRMVAGG